MLNGRWEVEMLGAELLRCAGYKVRLSDPDRVES